MPVPAFTQQGILPAGVHACTFLEAEQFLCSNQRRIEIWQGLQGFLRWAQGLPKPTAVLIDGSYVTDKALPGDVDIVVDITACNGPEQQIWFQTWSASQDAIKARFQVDFYPFVVGHGNDFSSFFQYVRVDEALRRGISPAERKGILRVAI